MTDKNKIRRLGIGYGRLKSENKHLKIKIKELEFQKNLLKRNNEELLKQLRCRNYRGEESYEN